MCLGFRESQETSIWDHRHGDVTQSYIGEKDSDRAEDRATHHLDMMQGRRVQQRSESDATLEVGEYSRADQGMLRQGRITPG